MGLEQKLLQLDEAIFRQYEKVTQKADYYFGWDKYDLARGCYNISMAGSVGSGLYNLFSYVKSGHPGDMANLIIAGAFGVMNYLSQKLVSLVELNDFKQLQQGYVTQPKSDISRVILPLLFVPFSLGIGVYYFEKEGWNDINVLRGLSSFGNAILMFSFVSGMYFKDQIPKPPSQSKGKVQEWFGKLGESVGKKEVVGVKYGE